MKKNLVARYILLCTVLFASSVALVAQRKVALPMVSFAAVPLYPPLARTANISGVVHVVVTTDGHNVVTARAQDGVKLLSDAAEKNAKSWQFAIHEPTTFTVTYVYKLVDDLKLRGDNPRVILQLPTDVEVDIARWPAEPGGAALK